MKHSDTLNTFSSGFIAPPSPKPISRHLMIILSIMVAIFTIGVGALLVQQHNHLLEDRVDLQVNGLSKDFLVLLNQQSAGLSTALQLIIADPSVKNDLIEGRRDHLLAKWQGIFKEMKKENKITHFYFLDKKRVCLLRVHKPEKYGDLINRFTAQEAEWTRKSSSGIEIGPLGTFTLRVVQPVFDGNTLIGYVELGKEIEDVLNVLHTYGSNEITVLIHKEYLKRQPWEEGMQMMNREANWEQLPRDAIVYTSLHDRLPSQMVSIVKSYSVGHDPKVTKDQEILYNTKRWRASIIPLKDVSGKEIGALFMMNDISTERSEFIHFLIQNILIGLTLMGLLLGFIFLVLRRTDTNIHLQQNSLRESQEEIDTLAFFDQLTGLPNRTLLLDRLKQAIANSTRNSHYGALLFIDLDNFKTLNDTVGHEVGDILLQQVAERLRACVREGDTVSRFGGDEFVVILSGLSKDETEAATVSEMVAEKILASLNQIYFLGNVSHRSTASIGVTLFRGDRMSVDDLMKQADLAMYQSKEGGRNGLSFFDPDMESALKKRSLLEEDLRRGIDECQFVLYYQAQVLDNSYITGTEALVRWQHPKRGLVGPVEFIPVAEETGLILPLGDWILKTACKQLAEWSHGSCTEHITMSVNVSPRQFSQSNFVERVLSIIDETGANPQRLKLELTESLLLQNIEEVIEKMVALKDAGVYFSLDDFGTGYSSLAYLKRLPLDQLKIDQSFVRDILSNTNDAIICKSTIALAESMGLSVIAEGVETQEQWNVLADLGCHAYQGYWFSRPLPLEEFETLLKIPTNDLSSEKA